MGRFFSHHGGGEFRWNTPTSPSTKTNMHLPNVKKTPFPSSKSEDWSEGLTSTLDLRRRGTIRGKKKEGKSLKQMGRGKIKGFSFGAGGA